MVSNDESNYCVSDIPEPPQNSVDQEISDEEADHDVPADVKANYSFGGKLVSFRWCL